MDMVLAKDYMVLKRTGIVAVLIVSACIIALLYANKIVDIEKQHISEEINLY